MLIHKYIPSLSLSSEVFPPWFDPWPEAVDVVVDGDSVDCEHSLGLNAAM